MEGSPSIVGLVLVQNEDRNIRLVLENILTFCDKVIVADHQSTDHTADIVENLSFHNPKVMLVTVLSMAEAHYLLQDYVGTDTWVFGVDGDELYNPSGLRRLRLDILAGKFQNYWRLIGQSFHSDRVSHDLYAGGWSCPPNKSVTKLYNFGHLEAWDGDTPERLHGGRLVFKPERGPQAALVLEKDLECLHLCFMTRSSRNFPIRDIVRKRSEYAQGPKTWIKAHKYFYGQNAEVDT